MSTDALNTEVVRVITAQVSREWCSAYSLNDWQEQFLSGCSAFRAEGICLVVVISTLCVT